MGRGSVLEVTAEQAVAYRVAAHHLHDRLPLHELEVAAGICGARDTPPGTAAMALAARVEHLVPGDVDVALHDDRTLVRLAGPRGVAHVVPSVDAALFGAGVLAADEESLREQLGSAWAAIEDRGWGAGDALKVVAEALAAVLADGSVRTKGELSDALHGRVPAELEPWCDACDAHHVPEQLFRLAGVAGAWCYGGSDGRRHLLVASDLWLGGPDDVDPADARLELVRRFVRAYGPVAPRHFAVWSGVGEMDARDRFEGLGDELVEVRVAGAPAWMRRQDLPALHDPPPAAGARLLPAGDPFLQQPDRSTLIADRATQRAVWRPTGRPGLVLVRGRPVATWRMRPDGGRAVLEVDPFDELGARRRAAVRQEVTILGGVYGVDESDVSFVRP